MKQRFAYWLIPAIAIGVALFLVLFVMKINEGGELQPMDPLPSADSVQEPLQTSEAPWMDRFSKSEQLGYFYPVNEIYIQADFNKKIVKQTIYRLSAQLQDAYKLFCLKQELNRYELRYYLKKEQKGVDLLIYSKDLAKLDHLLETLKTYNIKATISPYKEVNDGKI